MNDSPFAHRIARKPKTGKAPAETRPVPIILGHIPMTQDELASETEIETPAVKPAAVAPVPVASPSAAPAQPSSAMRQTLVALVAFTVTICIIAGAVLLLKSVFTSK